MRLKIGDFTKEWTIHPRPYGGDLVLTADGLVVVVDTGNRVAINTTLGNEPINLRQCDVDRLFDAEDSTKANPYPFVMDIVPGSIYRVNAESLLSTS